MKLVYLNLALIFFQSINLTRARWEWTANGFKFLINGGNAVIPGNTWALPTYPNPVPLQVQPQLQPKQQQYTSAIYFPSNPHHNDIQPLSSTYDQKSACVVPQVGDTSHFEMICSLNSTYSKIQDEDCTTLGDSIASGTTMILKCKPPTVSSSGKERLGTWTCDDGAWKGEFTEIKCVGPASTDTSESEPDSVRDPPEKRKSEPEPESPASSVPSWFQRFEKLKERHQLDFDGPILRENMGNNNSPSQPTAAPSSGWTPSTTTTTPGWGWKPPTETPNNAGWSSTTTSTTTTTTTTTRPTTTTTPYYYNWKLSESRKCPSLSKKTGVKLKCIAKIPLPDSPSSYVVTEDDCQVPQHVGSDATYQCEKYYEATSAMKTLYRKCKEDGTWSGGGDIFSCALECGTANQVGHIPLITHGLPTFKAQFPWHAAIFYRSSNPDNPVYNYNCGGTLINKKVVLTAAHCVVHYGSAIVKDLEKFRIDLGRHERAVDDEFVQTFYVEEVIVHPDYNPSTYDSDIAVVMLKGGVTIGYNVRPICYPQQQNTAFEDVHLASGSLGTVVGFGLNEDNVESESLRMARLKVISSKECALSYSDTLFGSSLAKSTTFCAGLQNGTNVCSGDSGGGIYFPASTVTGSKWYLRGLVSVGVQTQEGGIKKCDPTRYSIFTKISPYADWIGRILSNHDYYSYY